MSELFRPVKPRAIGEPLAPAAAPEPAASGQDNATWVKSAGSPSYSARPISSTMAPAAPAPLQPQIRSIAPGTAASPSSVAFRNPGAPEVAPLMRPAGDDSLKQAQGYYAREAKAASSAREAEIEAAQQAQAQQIDANNYEVSRRAARENRETVVNPTTGAKEFAFTDAEEAAKAAEKAQVEAEKAQQAKRNDSRERRFRQQGREFYTDSQGNIRPVDNREKFEADQAEAAKVKATKARNEETQTALATESQLYEIDKESRPVHEKPDELKKEAGAAVDEAIYTALAAKDLDKATRARLQALADKAMERGEPMNRADLPDDLAAAVGKHAPDQWAAAEERAADLATDQENRAWRAARESEIEKLRLKSINPAKWEARYGGKEQAVGSQELEAGGEEGGAAAGKKPNPEPLNTLTPEILPLPEREASYRQRAGLHAEKVRVFNESQEAQARQWDNLLAENDAMVKTGVTADQLVPMTLGDEERLIHRDIVPRLQKLTERFIERGDRDDAEVAGIEADANELRREAVDLDRARELENREKDAQFNEYLDQLATDPDLAPAATRYRDASADYEARRAAVEEDLTLTPEQKKVAHLAIEGDRKAQFEAAHSEVEAGNAVKRKRIEGHSKLLELADNAMHAADGFEILFDGDKPSGDKPALTPETRAKLYERQVEIIGQIAQESGISPVEAARAVRSYQDAATEWSPGENIRKLSNGKIAVNPAYTWDDERFMTAVGGMEDAAAKDQAIAARQELKKATVDSIVDGLRKTKSFSDFEEKQMMRPAGQRPRTEVEMVERYMAERGKTQAFIDNADMIIRQGGNDVVAQFYGFGYGFGRNVLHLGKDWSEKYRPVLEDLGDPGGTFNAANADMSAALNAAQVPQLVQDVGRAAISMAPALAAGGVGAALRPVITSALIRGSAAGTIGRTFLGNMVGRGGFSAITAREAARMASQAGLGGAGAGAFMQTFGSTYPEAVRAYQDSGMSFDEAADAAFLPAAGSATFTAAITMAFGKTGVESLLRGRAAGDVTAGELAAFLAKPGHRGQFLKAIKSKEFNEMAAKLAGTAGKDILGEAAEEGTDQLYSALVKLGTYEQDPDKTVADAIGEGFHAALIGGILGGGAAGVQMAASDARRALSALSKQAPVASVAPRAIGATGPQQYTPPLTPAAQAGAIVSAAESQASANQAPSLSPLTPAELAAQSAPSPSPSAAPGAQPSTPPPAGTPAVAGPAPEVTPSRPPLPEQVAVSDAEISAFVAPAGENGPILTQQARAMRKVAVGEVEQLSGTELAILRLKRNDAGKIVSRPLSKLEQEYAAPAVAMAQDGNVVLTTEGLEMLATHFPQTRKMVQMDEPQARAYFRDKAEQGKTTESKAPATPAAPTIEDELEGAGFPKGEPIIPPAPAVTEEERRTARAKDLATWAETERGLDAATAKRLAADHVARKGVTDPSWMIQALQDFGPEVNDAKAKAETKPETKPETSAQPATQTGPAETKPETKQEPASQTAPREKPPIVPADNKTAVEKLQAAFAAAVKRFAALGVDNIVEIDPEFAIDDGSIWVNQNNGRIEYNPARVEAIYGNRPNAAAELEQTIKHEFWHIATIQALIAKYGNLAKANEAMANVWTQFTKAYPQAAADIERVYEKGAFEKDPARGGWELSRMVMEFREDGTTTEMVTGAANSSRRARLQKVFQEHFSERGGFKISKALRSLLEAITEFISGLPSVTRELRELSDAAAAIVKDGVVPVGTETQGAPRAGQVWEAKSGKRYRIKEVTKDGKIFGTLESAPASASATYLGTAQGMAKNGRLVTVLKPAPRKSGKSGSDYDHHTTPLLNQLRETPIRSIAYFNGQRLNLFNRKRHGQPLNPAQKKTIQQINDYNDIPKVADYEGPMKPYLQGIFSMEGLPVDEVVSAMDRAGLIGTGDGTSKASDLGEAIHAEMKSLEARVVPIPATADQWTRRELNAKREMQDAGMWDWFEMVIDQVKFDWQISAMEELDEKTGQPTGKTEKGTAISKLLRRTAADLNEGDNIVVDKEELTVTKISDNGIVSLSNGKSGPSRFYETIITIEPGQVIYVSAHVDENGEAKITGQGSGATLKAGNPGQEGRFEAEQFELIDTPLSRPDAVAARKAEMDRMKIRAMQQRRLQGDDLVTQEDAFIDTRNEEGGQGLLFASNPSGIGQQFFDFGISGELSDNPNQLAFSFADTAKLAPEDPISDAEAAADPASAPESIPAKVELPAEEAPAPSLFPGDTGDLFARAGADEIADFGEKIGGARKDTARPLGPNQGKSRAKDTTPVWRRNIVVLEHRGRFQIFKDTGGGAVRPVSFAQFETEAEAEAAIPVEVAGSRHVIAPARSGEGFAIYRKISQQKRVPVRADFTTRQEAIDYLAEHPIEIIEHRFDFPEKPHLDWIDRTAPTTERANERGEDEHISPARFQEVFGFRAGEFGNWNMGTDGQAALDYAYDALLDLAGALNIPPRAISLNGELAVAFGARGTGGKNAGAAHYETDYRVINLTKINGAGSLAHEWYHALDHYFFNLSRQKGNEDGFVSRNVPGPHMRPEMKAAFRTLQDVMTAKKVDEAVVIPERMVTGSQTHLEEHLDGLRRRMVDPLELQYNKRYKAPTGEQLRQWDEAVARHIADPGPGFYKDADKPMKGLPSVFWKTYPELETLAGIYKAVLNRTFLKKSPNGYAPEAIGLTKRMIDTRERVSQAASGATEQRTRPTDYFSNAKFIDRFRVSDYWSTPHEMAARAFEAFVSDRLTAEGRQSPYLVNGVRDANPTPAQLADDSGMFMFPYPYQADRKAINAAFDRVFETMETKPTEKGQMLFASAPPSTLNSQPATSPSPFYSALERAVETRLPARFSPGQAIGTIEGTPSVKAEELKWSGFRNLIARLAEEAPSGKIEKADLLAALESEGRVRFEEVAMADPQRKGAVYDWAVSDGEENTYFRSYEEAAEYADQQGIRITEDTVFQATNRRSATSDPRFSQYQLPGGENYREVVLSMPESKASTIVPHPKPEIANRLSGFAVRFSNGEYAGGNDRPSFWMTEEAAREGTEKYRDEYQVGYTSSHFPNVPNYVAHMRTNERTDAEGNPGLFIEELQSDRHQAGRDKGYQEPFEEWMAYYETPEGTEVPVAYGKSSDDAANNVESGWKDLVTVKTRKSRDGVTGGTPDAPFRKDWSLALFKRALRDAVASGKEWIGWTTGETQNDRYDLSKHIDRIVWAKPDKLNPGYTFSAWKDTSRVLHKNNISEQELEDHIGKDLAKRIIESPDETGKLADDGLRLGGSGMKGFYDNILPKEIGKYVKQWGATIAGAELPLGKGMPLNSIMEKFMGTDWGTSTQEQKDIASAMQAGRRGVTIHRVTITPEMRRTVSEVGQPLYASNPNQLSFDFGTSGTLGGKNEIDLDFSSPAGQTTGNGVKPTSKSSAPDGSDDIMRWAGEQAALHPGAVPLPAIEPDAAANDGPTSREIQREAVAALVRIARDGLIEPGDREALKAGFKDSRRVANIIPELVDGTTTWDIVGAKVTTPEEFFALNAVLRNPYFESVRVAVLDDNNLVVHAEVLNIGTINESIVDLARIARMMGIAKAKGVTTPQVVMSHNHPGGDPSPSSHDRQLQSRLEDMVEKLGGTVLDHVITNGTRGYTLRGDHEFTMPEESQVPWVHFERTKMPQMSGPDSVLAIAKSLRAMNPDARYLVLLDNRFKLIGIEQLPEGTPSEVGAAATISATSIGANRVMILDPKHLPGIREIKKALNAANVEFVDSLYIKEDGEYFSARESGLMEPSESYNLKAANPDTSVPPSTLNSQPSTSTSPLLRTIAAMPAKPRAFVTALLAGDTVADAAKTAGYTTTDPQALAAGIGRRLLSQLAQQGVTAEQAREMVESEMGGAPTSPVLKAANPESDAEYDKVFQHRLKVAKEEINRDIESGLVDSSVKEFSDLHDYVDGNEYINDAERPDRMIGSLGKSRGWKGQDYIKISSELVDTLSDWLANGRRDSTASASPSLPTLSLADGRVLQGPGEFKLRAAIPGTQQPIAVDPRTKEIVPNPLYEQAEPSLYPRREGIMSALEAAYSPNETRAERLRNAMMDRKRRESEWVKKHDKGGVFLTAPEYIAAAPHNTGEYVIERAAVISPTPRKSGGWRRTGFHRITGPGYQNADFKDGDWVPIAHDEHKDLAAAYEAVPGDKSAMRFTAKPLFAAIPDAYHGTPHKIDPQEGFRTDKIGTGEGAQAYGHGLYFAESDKTARGYRDGLSQRKVVYSGKFGSDSFPLSGDVGVLHETPKAVFGVANGIRSRLKNGQEFSSDMAEEIIASQKKRLDDEINEKQRGLEQYRKTGSSPLVIQAGNTKPIEDAIKYLQTARGELDRISASDFAYESGNLYTVRLKPDDEEMLDWDKPLGQQSEQVQKAMKSLYSEKEQKRQAEWKKPDWAIDREEDRTVSWWDSTTGSTAYTLLHNREGGAEKASRLLAGAKIKGIRYRDANTRFSVPQKRWHISPKKPGIFSVTDGINGPEMGEFISHEEAEAWVFAQPDSQKPTYNYVIFDEADIEIIAENGKPVTMASALRASTPPSLNASTPANDYGVIEEVEKYAQPTLSARKAWLTPGGKWVNVITHEAAIPKRFNGYYEAMYDRGYVRIFSDTDGLSASGPRMNARQLKEFKDTAIEKGVEAYDGTMPWTTAKFLAASTPPSPSSRAPGETLFDAAINRVTSTIAATDTVANLKDYLAAQYAKPFARPLHRFVDFLLKQAIPLQRLPQEVNALMQEMAIKQSFAQQKAMDVIRSVSGKAKFSDLAWPAKYVNDKGMRKRLFLAMQGKLAMSSLPPEVQAIATQLRARLNKAAIDAVRQGRMHPDTYRDMEQTYMPHYYYDHEKAAAGSLFARLKLGLGDMMAQRTTMWRIEDLETKDPFTGEDGALIAWDDKGKKVRFKNKQHRDAFYHDFLKSRTVDEIHRRGKVAAFSAATKAQIDKLTAADLNRPDQLTDELRGYAKRVEQEMKARYHKGDPLTEEEQEQAGLIYDPVYAIAKHLATMEHDNATAEFFNTLATMPGYLGDEGVAGFTKLPDNRKLGRLAGKYVRDDVSEEVLALVNAPSDLARFYDGMLALWKTGKTVYNPGTHVRNVMGNLLFAQMAGVNPFTNAQHFREGIKILLKGGPLLEELYQEGVLGGDFLTAELRQDLAAMLPEMTTDPGDDVWFKLAATVDRIVHRTGAKQAKRLIEAAYAMEDEMFKAASYLKAKATGMTSKEAAAHTRKWFPYYDQIGTSSAIRALRRGPMPFFSFQREALRILANAAKERPASLAFALAAPAILSAISAALLGLDDDDEKDIWKTAMRGKGKFFGRNTPMFSILLPNRSTEGRLQQFDLTNVMPFASLLGSRMEIDNGTPAWQQWALELITSSPITGIPLEMAFNTDTFSNRPIWEENMTPGEKRGAAAKYVWSQLMPPLAPGGTGWNMAANAGTRVSNKSLERRNAGQAWLRAVVGIDVRNASPNLYAMAEQFRTAEGLDQPDFAGYGTTPESRARARLFGELVQDAPSIDTLAKDLAFLKRQGRPIETEQDLNRLLFYRNPIMVIDGEDNQRKFRRSLSPEARAVLAEAESEFKRIQRTSGPILRRASVAARKITL